MASENAVLPGGGDLLRTAPDHVVDMILALMPVCADPSDVEQARAKRATARAYANRIWAEAAHTGAAWGLARVPFECEVPLAAAPLLGDLIRDTVRE